MASLYSRADSALMKTYIMSRRPTGSRRLLDFLQSAALSGRGGLIREKP
jgi:hypothetical protein